VKSLLSVLSRYALTISLAVVSGFVGLQAWRHYERTPWTRDGRVSVDVVQIAPEVSGTIRTVRITDNQYVKRGDVLYEIDPERLRLAVALAEADVEAKYQDMVVRQATAQRKRQLKLNDVVSQEAVQQSSGAAAMATAAYQAAVATQELAKLDLARSIIRSPVDGYVTNLKLRPGDYATAGATNVAIVDGASFWITGYFEETKIQQIRVAEPVRFKLMGFDQPVTGHVESIGRGIENSSEAPGRFGLPNVAATFSWVRLAQRIPVRIHIDQVPSGVELAAGMTATIEIVPADVEAKADRQP
jgi:multidrug resistance efflux pump